MHKPNDLWYTKKGILMKLIFIRHGEPNYEIDSLTEKGWREAELLSKRTVKWNVTDFYCSPLGRAKDTASFTLKNAGREAEILPWLREFDAPVLDPETGKRRIPWDFLPDVLDANRDLYDNNLWTKNPIMQTGNMDENYHFVTDGLDALLARYGYVRDGYRYHASDETNREAVIVCFCHLGVTCALTGRSNSIRSRHHIQRNKISIRRIILQCLIHGPYQHTDLRISITE